jgi:Protein of unknown function (DUF1573)
MKGTTQIIGIVSVIGLLSAGGTVYGQAPGGPGPRGPVKTLEPVPTAPAQPPAPQAAPTGPQPKIVIEKMDHEFGRISDEQKLTVEFPFTNNGEGPLVFKDQPRASCGCTAGKLPKLEFAPGEGGTLTVTYDPHGKHGDQNQRVMADTNDPAMNQVICKFHAFVSPTITIEPPIVGFGEVLSGQTARQVVKVRGPKDFAVTYASNTKGRFLGVRVIETHEVTVDNEQASESLLEFTLNGNAPRGTLQALTTARTTNDKHPLVDIQVTAEVVGDLQVLPPRVNVGVLEGGQSFSKTFRVASRTDKPFKVKSVEQKSSTTPSPLTISVTPAEQGKESAYQIEISGSAPNPGTPLMASLLVTTDQANEDKIEVQINGIVRAPAPPMPASGEMQAQPAAPGGVFQPPAAPGAPAAPAAKPADATPPKAMSPASPAVAPKAPGAK